MDIWNEAKLQYRVNFTEMEEGVEVALSKDRKDAYLLNPCVEALTGTGDVKADENGVVCLKANKVYRLSYANVAPRCDIFMDVSHQLREFGIPSFPHILRENQDATLQVVVSMFKQFSFTPGADPLVVLRYL